MGRRGGLVRTERRPNRTGVPLTAIVNDQLSVSATGALGTVLSAAFDARRILRRVATYSQAPDHPIIPMIPETEYLKGFAFEVVR